MGKVIVIDAGHGGIDPGACGNGLKEKDINLQMAKKVGAALSAFGFIIVYTRTGDVLISLVNRAATANNSKADFFLSLHCNAAENILATGIETLVYHNGGENAKIASLIQDELIKTSGMSDRGVKNRPDLAVLNSTRMTAALIELGFISNANDADKLKNDVFLDKCANAVSRAICHYFEVDTGNTDITAKDNKDEVPDWQRAAFQKAKDSGRIKSPEYWENRLDEPITIGEAFSIIANI